MQEIKEGRFTEGGRIPSERDLAEKYGISRASVRETVTELINAGILFRTVGHLHRHCFRQGPGKPADPQHWIPYQ